MSNRTASKNAAAVSTKKARLGVAVSKRTKETKAHRNQNKPNSQPAKQTTAADGGQGGVDPKTAQEFLTGPRQHRDKPKVNLPQGKTTISESAENLFRAIAPTKELFNHGGTMAEIVKDQKGHRLQNVASVAAQSRFEKYVHFVKRTGKEELEAPTVISKAIVEQFVASESFRLLPKINGIVHCPMLIEKDGKLHLVDTGYDETTGYLVINAKPVQEMSLDQAVGHLKFLVENFHFVTPGDRSRALASIITPALKLGGLLKRHIAVDVAEADQSQAGKTYRQKLIAAVYNQKLAVVTVRTGGVGSTDETLCEHLIKGATFIQFDNLRGKLNSQFLESFVTGDGKYSARVPYRGGVDVDPAGFIIMVTSNGFITTKDLANRSSIIRIMKREGYQYPVFDKDNDLLAHVFENQSKFLGAVFTIVRHWHEQGKQRTNETRHDFKEWCQTLDWIVQNILHEAPLMDGHQEAKARTADPGLTFLRQVALQVKSLKRLGQPLIATDLFELCDEAGIQIPGVMENNRHDVETGKKQIGKIMAGLFGADKVSIIVEDMTVTRDETRVKTPAGNPQSMKKYCFSSTEKPPAASPAPLVKS